MADALLGIDLGTTAVKLGAFHADTGACIAITTREYALQTPRDHWAELDAEHYWQAIVEAMAALRPQLAGHAISAIGLSSQAQTFLLLNADQRPLRPAIVWLDTRAHQQCDALLNQLGPDAFAHHTGFPFPPPIASAPKLLWLRQHEPDTWRRLARVTMLPAWIGYRLTGHFACDPCNLASTCLHGEHGWWDDALALLGLTTDHLDSPIPTGQRIGDLTAAAATALGLPAGLAVGAGSNDQLTGALGTGNVRPGLVSGAIGTAMALVGTLPHTARGGALPTYPHAIQGLRYAMPFAMTTGMLLRWFRDHFGEGRDYDQLVAMAADIPPGADGLTLLPHFAGTGPPTFRDDVTGAWLGPTLAHRPAHHIRAILEAVSFTVRDAIELLRRDHPVEWQTLRILGGATRSPLWMQLIADSVGIPVELPACSEAAVCGAALCGGVAAGHLPDLANASTAWYRPARTFQPSGTTAYEAPYQRYRHGMQALYPGALP